MRAFINKYGEFSFKFMSSLFMGNFLPESNLREIFRLLNNILHFADQK